MPTPNDEPTDTESQSNDIDIYPMPMFARMEVTDMEDSTDWYREVAGFREVAPLPGIAHLRYRKYADVMLVPADESERPEQAAQATSELAGNGLSLTLNVENETVDDVFERTQSHDATVVSGPEATPWNTRQITLADPDGYRLVFTEPVDTELDFETAMDSLDSE
ncbi:Uncharacterized conserved protein PhnB, glyoxalase superfamily [Haladaptatus litoreus]|uniref:Uncharacterized conserved protein PhnB, glyoxalase superfamily n=2 Tax=Haladaptatus litoreus TaxID=553468 RepID=A0A1N6ZGY7_9EURY|nr:Uncharacterized conserved protein PhnB, glyoxalase superfamily [Haladaptatus litoreus]